MTAIKPLCRSSERLQADDAHVAVMLPKTCGDLHQPLALQDLGADGVRQPQRRRLEHQPDLIGCRRVA